MTLSYQRYDRIAPSYDSAIRPLERWFLQRLRKEAIAALPGSGRILELGAGTVKCIGFDIDDSCAVNFC